MGGKDRSPPAVILLGCCSDAAWGLHCGSPACWRSSVVSAGLLLTHEAHNGLFDLTAVDQCCAGTPWTCHRSVPRLSPLSGWPLSTLLQSQAVHQPETCQSWIPCCMQHPRGGQFSYSCFRTPIGFHGIAGPAHGTGKSSQIYSCCCFDTCPPIFSEHYTTLYIYLCEISEILFACSIHIISTHNHPASLPTTGRRQKVAGSCGCLSYCGGPNGLPCA